MTEQMQRALLILVVACGLGSGCSKQAIPPGTGRAVYTDLQRELQVEWTLPPRITRDYQERICFLDLDAGSRRYVSPLGYNASPVFSPNGEAIAYFFGMVPELRIYNIETDTTRTLSNTRGAYRLHLNWLSDGKSVVYSTDDEIVILSIADGGKMTFPVKNAEDVSASPNGKFLAYWRREGKDENDADGWILYRLQVGDGTTVSYGEKDDGHGIVGACYWDQDSTRLLVMVFNVDDQNERSDIRYRWFSQELEALDFPNSDPMVIQQYRHPWNAEYDLDL